MKIWAWEIHTTYKKQLFTYETNAYSLDFNMSLQNAGGEEESQIHGEYGRI